MANREVTVIQENLNEVRDRIAAAAVRAGRDVGDVTLVAVTKTFPVDAIKAAWEAGQRHFGENRPEAGARKIPQLRDEIGERPGAAAGREGGREGALGLHGRVKPQQANSDMPVWHMIGHIQSRKSDTVARYFDFVHSVDRYKIARRLSAPAEATGREIPVLLECNVSGETSKYGYATAGWEGDADVRAAFLSEVERLLSLPGLRVAGLMTVGPFVDDPEQVRPVFASLRGLRDLLADHYPEVTWRHLSMGMTSDFEVAVEEGATLVRIGRAIFGARS